MTLFKKAVAVICAFYLTISLSFHYHISTIYLLGAGLLMYSFFDYCLNYFLDPAENKGIDKRLMLVSIVLSSLIVFAIPGIFNLTKIGTHTEIKITATGNKLERSHGSEVWITAVYNNNVPYKLEDIPLPVGWEIKNNCIVSYSHQPATLVIAIKDPILPQVILTKHDWSGIVKIEEGSQTTNVDLYSGKPGSFIYQSDPANFQGTWYSWKEKIVLVTISILGLAILCYLIMLVAFPYYMPVVIGGLAFFSPIFPSLILFEKLLLLALSIAVCSILRKPAFKEFERNTTRAQKVLFLLAVIYTGFAFIGHRLFLSDYPVLQIKQKLAVEGLFSWWLGYMALAFLYGTSFLKSRLIKKNNDQNYTPALSIVKLYGIFVPILLACWSLYLIAFYPANMSPDSISEWMQANGTMPLDDSHPYIYTLLIRGLQSIWYSPAVIGIFHMLMMSAVCSSFLVFFYKTGIRLPWLIGFAILLGLVPVNGMMAVTIWKDVPYCYSLLWLTLIITEIITKNYIFSYRTTAVCLFISLIGVALFRHNGTVAVIPVAIAVIYWAIKNKNKIILYTTGLALVVVVAYKKVVIPYMVNIIPAPSGLQLLAPIHGIASVMYYNGKLTKETTQEMEKVMPDSVWVSNYDPYSIDTYAYFSNAPFFKNLAKIPTVTGIKMYARTWIDNPYLVTRDRLDGTELLWNVSRAKRSFNYAIHPRIDKNDMGFKQSDNGMKRFLLKILEFSETQAELVLERPGVFNILTLLLLLLFIKQRRSYGLIFLPLIASNLSLMLSMAHQSFRYVYYVPLLFGFLWLLALSSSISSNYSKKLFQ
jgi:hypothetical protein